LGATTERGKIHPRDGPVIGGKFKERGRCGKDEARLGALTNAESTKKGWSSPNCVHLQIGQGKNVWENLGEGNVTRENCKKRYDICWCHNAGDGKYQASKRTKNLSDRGKEGTFGGGLNTTRKSGTAVVQREDRPSSKGTVNVLVFMFA